MFFLELLYPFCIFISFRHLRCEAVNYVTYLSPAGTVLNTASHCVKITAVQNDIICTHMG